MNLIVSYNSRAKDLTNDLKGGYNSNSFLLLDVYLNEKAAQFLRIIIL